jgi:hypothetical protein
VLGVLYAASHESGKSHVKQQRFEDDWGACYQKLKTNLSKAFLPPA